MKHLENINPNKFYTRLVLEGHLVEEIVEGVDEDGNWSTFFNFDDAVSEAKYEDVTLNEYGNATYYYEGKVYEVVVYLENNEGTGINELEIDEIKSLINKLRRESDELGISELDFLQKEPWVNEILNHGSSTEVIYVLKGNFGDLTLNINGTEATGSYEENGNLKGEFVKNTFKGQWENKGMKGLLKFKITDNKLEGNWKKGLEPGPMKGKWEGKLVDFTSNNVNVISAEDSENWDIEQINIREILFSNCEGTSGQDVALSTSSFLPVDHFDEIINYLNQIFSDEDASYLFKYKKYQDGEILLYASTYLLRLGGDVFENDIDEYRLDEIVKILDKNGIHNKILSIIEIYSEEGTLTVVDLIENLLVKPSQTVNVECIDNVYGNSSFEIIT